MSRVTVWSATWVLVLAAWTLARGEEARTFYGEVSDSQCAFNVHSLTRSHQEMLKSKSMGGTAIECSLYCIQHLGGNLALSSKKDVYHLDNQNLALKFIGQKVKLSGILDPKTETIRVVKIEAQR
jgi:hypothetical protein